ncbi:PAS/PAC sensor signal transduction histidine kinase [Micromonospora pattaloongensis]|uniref:histidine kinase n=1 Tax=Micromonospora pattaloongensis TaxID=405436 RepID=A0A1H3HR19_9ACTN|nr:ATP-binding protein [Micromonospora pattaloongensis]SDY17238.1 PAS/PAC sensor signal transduction histidine kinase [Micromonospora pattaloongensis]
MPESPDYAALIAGHTAVIEMINSGEGGLPVLDRMLQLAQRALGATGVSFVEYGRRTGRIIGAVGAAEWELGRPVERTDPGIARLLTGARTQEFGVDDVLSGEQANQLSGRGLRRVLTARAEIGGLVIGTLHAYYSDAAERAHPDQHVLIAYLAACIAHMYGDHYGLPVHGDGPVVAALADGLAIVDQHDRVLLWNPAAETVTGRPAAQMRDRPLPFPVPPPGQVIDHQLPDGRWLRITSGELPGQAESRVITFRDTTDQRQRDHDRDLFFAVTSHELRTPVTVIKGYADTLNNHWDSLPESERLQAARTIGQRAGELARLVDRLLSAANDVGPVGGSAPVPFDLLEALRVAARGLPADLRHRLALDLPVDLPKALGDRASLATVLTELATNAVKYSPPGTPIELTAESDERTVVFRVSDRGIGVRPEHVERAFDRFWQGEQGDRRQYPGAGLGLYLVRRIVERQKGWVSLRPREGGGTVAEVRLPRG